MGERGPVPKRSDQRRRVNKPEVPIDSAPGSASDDVEVPEASLLWLPATKRWYESLAQSGQSRWYEPSDWAQAWILTELLDREMQSGKPNGMVISAWMSGAAELLTTEGSRRRMRIELAKANQGDPDLDSAVSDLEAFRQMRSGGAG